MGCSYMFCHNNYAFSLLFYKVYMKRENAGSWNSGPKRSKLWKPVLHNSKSPEIQHNSVSENIKKNLVEEVHEGGHRLSTRVGVAPLSRRAPVS